MIEQEVTKSLEQVRQLIDRGIAGLGEIGPEVVRATGTAIFARGLCTLLGATIFVCIAFGVAHKLLKAATNAESLETQDALRAIGYVLLGVGLFVALVVYTTPGNWLAIFDQKAWLANEVLNKVL